MGKAIIGILAVFLICLIGLTLNDVDKWLESLSRKRKNRKLLKNLSKNKEIPKPLGSLNKGDTLYYLRLEKFNNSLLTLDAKDVNKCFADKAMLEDMIVCKVDRVDGENIFCQDSNYFTISKKNVEGYVDYNGVRIISTSLDLLSIYLKKMENDTKLDIINTLKKNEASRDGSKVSEWLDGLNQKNLSLKK